MRTYRVTRDDSRVRLLFVSFLCYFETKINIRVSLLRFIESEVFIPFMARSSLSSSTDYSRTTLAGIACHDTDQSSALIPRFLSRFTVSVNPSRSRRTPKIPSSSVVTDFSAGANSSTTKASYDRRAWPEATSRWQSSYPGFVIIHRCRDSTLFFAWPTEGDVCPPRIRTRILWCHGDPVSRRRTVCRLLLEGLSPSISSPGQNRRFVSSMPFVFSRLWCDGRNHRPLVPEM